MNLAQLRELAIGKAAGPSQAMFHADTAPTLVDAWINEAYQKIARSFVTKFHDGEATLTVSTTGAVSGVPADFQTPLMLQNVTAPQPFELEYYDGSQRFLPQDAARFSQQVQAYEYHNGAFTFWPVPGAATQIRMRYLKRWLPLTVDADVPVIPEAFHDLLATYAAAHIARRHGKAGQAVADLYQQEWETGLMQMATSPLMVRSADRTNQEFFAQSLFQGQGVDW